MLLSKKFWHKIFFLGNRHFTHCLSPQTKLNRTLPMSGLNFTMFAAQNPHIIDFIISMLHDFLAAYPGFRIGVFLCQKRYLRGFMKLISEQQPIQVTVILYAVHIMYCFQRYYFGHVTCILELTQMLDLSFKFVRFVVELTSNNRL